MLVKVAEKNRDIQAITIGSSAGGIEALKSLLVHVPKGFSGCILVVQHLGTRAPATLVNFFSQVCTAPVKEMEDKAFIEAGTIYFAPPGYHALVESDYSFSLSVDDAVNFARPSIDVLMESVADVYRDKAAGIILTGANHDGAEGLKAIKEAGGITMVQDPATASFSSMPEAAIETQKPDFILTLPQIAGMLQSWS